MLTLLLLACRPPGPSLDAVARAVPQGARAVDQADGAPPIVVLLEVAAGDPRTPDAPPDTALLQALRDAGIAHLVHDLDAPPPGWDSHPVDPVPAEDLANLRRFARLVEAPRTPLAAARDLALSTDRSRTAWDHLREESARRFAAFEAQAAERGERLADAALALDEPALVAVPPMSAPAALARARAAGRAAVHLRPAALDDLHDPEVWWARLRAALPAPAPPDGQLPSFDPWIDALRPHVAAVRGWDEADALRAQILAAVGPPPSPLADDDPLRPVLTAAAHRLREALQPGTDAARTLGDPVATLATLRVCGRPMPDTPMSYDPLFDVLKVDGWVADLPLDLVAVVLAHELVHVHDVRAAAAALDTDPAGWAFAHDTLPLGVGLGVTLLGEDRAFRVELALVAATDVALPDPEAARHALLSRAPPSERLPAILRVLQGSEPGSLQWLSTVSDLIPAPR